MRVRVLEKFSPYYNYGIVDLAADEEVKGGLALHLLQIGAAVEPIDDDARTWVAADAAEPDDEDGKSGKLAPPEELDIDDNVADVLAWVGDDPERAAEALNAEQAKDAPRSTLVAKLEKLAADED